MFRTIESNATTELAKPEPGTKPTFPSLSNHASVFDRAQPVPARRHPHGAVGVGNQTEPRRTFHPVRERAAVPSQDAAPSAITSVLMASCASTNSSMLACIGVPYWARNEATELMAHQKWSTCRIPARYARSISVHVALEWPHVTRHLRRRAAR